MSDILIFAFIGGIFGAVLMDITETAAARRGITSGVNVALIGRWAIFLARGTLRHRDIRQAQPQQREVMVGWLFHLLIGGGTVALLLPLSLGWGLSPQPVPLTDPVPYVLFGLATSVLPWFILLPCFGWGWFGRRGPQGSNALLASPLSHVPYGLGIWFVVSLASSTFDL